MFFICEPWNISRVERWLENRKTSENVRKKEWVESAWTLVQLCLEQTWYWDCNKVGRSEVIGIACSLLYVTNWQCYKRRHSSWNIYWNLNYIWAEWCCSFFTFKVPEPYVCFRYSECVFWKYFRKQCVLVAFHDTCEVSCLKLPGFLNAGQSNLCFETNL